MTTTQQDLFVSAALNTWELAIKRASTVFDGCTDAELEKEIVPGKNRVIYLLGHLTAVHDRMLPLLGLGARFYPELDELFVTNPDDTAAVYPTAHQLREYWKTVNRHVSEQLQNWAPQEWLQRHMAVSEEDFAREPHRNRFNLVINRAGHVQYHLGQLAWLKK
jgi:Mlc titration factor MtfA (ptsG expression regulator)